VMVVVEVVIIVIITVCCHGVRQRPNGHQD